MEFDYIVLCSLIVMYTKCGDLHSAENIVLNLLHQYTASWTAMITYSNQTVLESERKSIHCFVLI
jgi:hypothetical protein